jgi:hypothetical protein
MKIAAGQKPVTAIAQSKETAAVIAASSVAAAKAETARTAAMAHQPERAGQSLES